mmetsp:Transcript_16720/g.25266  ORF Transcript_16720/g.25266 Transcript_16720/m.25266 type:complete len:93 (+) Transcript_16720:2996-3274(+)
MQPCLQRLPLDPMLLYDHYPALELSQYLPLHHTDDGVFQRQREILHSKKVLIQTWPLLVLAVSATEETNLAKSVAFTTFLGIGGKMTAGMFM